MDIIWKDVNGYEGLYKISDQGEIRSLGNSFSRKEKLLKLDYSNEYPKLELFKNGKRNRKLLHRLLAEHFIPNPDNLPFINHIDNNKRNYNITNLEWCSPKYNVNHYFDNFHVYKDKSIRTRKDKIIYFLAKHNISKEEVLTYF